jgi:hypothetical protein
MLPAVAGVAGPVVAVPRLRVAGAWWQGVPWSGISWLVRA